MASPLIERAAELAKANGGRLEPEALLAAAAPDDSPLHKYFEWDDKKAGHQHRLSQARALIRSIRVDVVHFSKTSRVPAYVRDPDAGPREQGYVATVKTDVDFRKEALAMELRRSGWTLERARGIAAYFGLEAQVTHLLTGVSEIEAALSEIE